MFYNSFQSSFIRWCEVFWFWSNCNILSLSNSIQPDRVGNYHVKCIAITSGSLKWVFTSSKSEIPIVECVRSLPRAKLSQQNECLYLTLLSYSSISSLLWSIFEFVSLAIVPLVAGNWQYLNIVIQTNGDCLNDATLALTSSVLMFVDSVPPEIPSIQTNALCIPRTCSLEPSQVVLRDNVITLPSSIGTNETFQLNVPVFSPSSCSFNVLHSLLRYLFPFQSQFLDLIYDLCL